MELKPSQEVLEKIKKLLALGNSDNENEAKIATQKANELLLKHNLSMQQIEGYEPDYEISEVAEIGLTYKPYQNMITNILGEFFFVETIIQSKFKGYSSGQWGKRRAQFKKVIKFIGTKENTQIAGYIFEYLNRTYPELWKEYFNKTRHAKQTDKFSYYEGLSQGIKKMLRETKVKVEQEYGLVLVRDPKLEVMLNAETKGKSYGVNLDQDIEYDVYSDGVEDGKKVRLRKGIESDQTGEGVTKRLIGGR